MGYLISDLNFKKESALQKIWRGEGAFQGEGAVSAKWGSVWISQINKKRLDRVIILFLSLLGLIILPVGGCWLVSKSLIDH